MEPKIIQKAFIDWLFWRFCAQIAFTKAVWNGILYKVHEPQQKVSKHLEIRVLVKLRLIIGECRFHRVPPIQMSVSSIFDPELILEQFLLIVNRIYEIHKTIGYEILLEWEAFLAIFSKVENQCRLIIIVDQSLLIVLILIIFIEMTEVVSHYG